MRGADERIATHSHAEAHSEAEAFWCLSPAFITFPNLLKRLFGG